VRIDQTLAGKSKLVAVHRGVTLAGFLTAMCRGPVDRAYARMVRELEGADQ
jgi:hypothetical protein